MDNKDTREYTMDDLEEIIREYSTRPATKAKKDTAPLPRQADDTIAFGKVNADTIPIGKVSADTIPVGKVSADTVPFGKVGGDTAPFGKVASDTVAFGAVKSDTIPLGKKPGDTIPLGGKAEKMGDTIPLGGKGRVEEKSSLQDTKPIIDEDEDVRVYRPAVPRDTSHRHKPKPPQPIAFPENRARTLQEKLEEGPRRRYQQLSEMGQGRLQAGIYLNLILFLAASAMALLFSRVEGGRLQLMVLGQMLILLMSAASGYKILLDGCRQMHRRRFHMSSLLVISFVLCALDGLICVFAHRLPFAAAFVLQMLMAQWAEYQKLQTEMSQMDTLRKAVDLTAVVKTPGFHKTYPAYHTTEGHLEDFMDHYRQENGPERILCRYAFGAVVLGAVLALISMLLHGVAEGIRVYAAALLAAMPATIFVGIQRPMAILEKRMHRLGTVLCGWRGLQNIEKQGYYPLHHKDLFPDNHVKLNGMRFYGERNVNTIVSYMAALMAADGGSLAVPFEQLRASRNARVCRVENLTSYPDGVGGQIDGLSVVAGTLDFMENMGVMLPDGARIPHAVYVAVNQGLCAVFAVSFTRSKSSASGLRTLCDSHHVRPVLVDCDFALTGAFLEQKLGVDIHRMHFPDSATRGKLSQKKPEKKTQPIALATRRGLAQRAYAVTGGAALRSAWRAGAAVHIMGGSIGFLAVAVLALQGSLFLLTPYNLLLYGCVWMIPGLLVAEWTRSI